MAEKERPQYYANELQPVRIAADSLRDVQRDLQVAIEQALLNSRTKDPVGDNFGTIFSGQPGE